MKKLLLVLSIVTLTTACGSGGGSASTANDTNVTLEDINYNKLSVTRSLSTTDYGYTVVESPHPVRAGQYSQRFELRAGDCGIQPEWNDCETDRSRSEVIVDQNMYAGDEYWFSYSVFFPSDFEAPANLKSTIGQIKPRGGPVGTYAGFLSKPNLFQFYAKGDEYNLCWMEVISSQGDTMCRDIKLVRLSDVKGRWIDIALQFSTNLYNGFAKVYVNGELKGSYDKPIVTYDAIDFFAKYGIYNTLISRNDGPMPTQIVYFDEVKIEKIERNVFTFNPAVD